MVAKVYLGCLTLLKNAETKLDAGEIYLLVKIRLLDKILKGRWFVLPDTKTADSHNCNIYQPDQQG